MAKVYAMFIMNRDGIALFTRNFAEEKIPSDLVTSLIMAISSFIKEISPRAIPVLRRIEAEDFTIMIEAGEAVLGALFVDKEDLLAREYLRAVVNEFERMFGDRLASWDGDTSLFETFGEICDKIMSIIAVNSYHIPRLGEGGMLSDRVAIPRPLWAVLKLVDGRRTVAEIAKEAGIGVEEAIQRFRKLVEEGLVDVDISEPLRKVVGAYLEALNKFLNSLSSLLGTRLTSEGLSLALKKWGAGWLSMEVGPRVEAKDLNRLAWLHTPREASEMLSSFLEVLQEVFRPILGALAHDLRMEVEAYLREKHGMELRRLEAWEVA